MAVASVSVRDFRSYESAEARLGRQLTIVCGANGAGKTNLLESIYFGATGRSCRTGNDRELLRFGAATTRVVLSTDRGDSPRELAVGFTPGEPKRMTADGAPVERLLDVAGRPLVSVFLPDRLDLIKGVPALRRAHLDQVVAALWPPRAGHRRAYAAALAQRNALVARLRDGRPSSSGLDAWDRQLAHHALLLMADRRAAVELVAPVFAAMASRLGLDGDPAITYRPRSQAISEDDLVVELAERRAADIERGYTGHGPHRDDLAIARGGRELRTYGSQGQQRLGLLALLLAEREVIGQTRDEPPLMLLDDVMSELDAARRLALVELLRETDGQALITSTDLEHVPGAETDDVTRILVEAGRLLGDPLAVAADPGRVGTA